MKKFLITLLIIPSFSFSQEIYDLIPLINLPSGEKRSLQINDLFYSNLDYRITFMPDSSLKVFYDTTNGLVEITSLKESEGFGVLPFDFYNKTYYIFYKTTFRQTVFFSFKPWKQISRVNLFGTFNGWNREQLPMTDEDNDGVYTTGIPLEPGRYEYKFFIDLPDDDVNGTEIIDSLNSERVPNGLGDWNSVIEVKPLNEDKAYLHILNYSVSRNNTSFCFYCDSPSHNNSGDKKNTEVLALLDNWIIPANSVEIHDKRISVNIPSEKLKGEQTLRVAVNEKSMASNLQTVMLKDGRPLDNKSSTWKDAVIYSIMIDRFSDGDSANSIPVEHPELYKPANYNGGDLQGIINKLEYGYFNSLGVNTLWISPVVDNTPNAYKEYPPPHRYYTGYHGYWPVHPAKVEERFGDMDLLKKLVQTAHDKGIRILLDYVAHHVHIEHPFWKEHPEWFGTLDLPDGRKNLRLWDEHRLTTWFEPYMPSFNFAGSEEAIELMTDNAIWWLKETGADGFRHDAVKHVPNEFWRTLTRKIKEEFEIPGEKVYYQIGETFGSYELISSYVNNGQLNAQFNFNLYDIATPVFSQDNSSFENLDKEMQRTFAVYGVNHIMGNIIDSHDKVRFMAYADGDVQLNDPEAGEIGWNSPPEVDHQSSYEKLKLFFTYLLTIPGVPVIYYGDEIGMTGAADPDNRRMMRFDEELTGSEKKTLYDVSKIINIRRQHTALRYGDFQTLFVNEDCYAYLRSDLNERILVVMNKGLNEADLEIQLPEVYNPDNALDLISNETYKTDGNTIILKLKPLSRKVLKIN